MSDRYITRHELATLYAVSTRTVDEWRRRGLLPAPTLTPTGRPRWLESEARAALSVAARTSTTPSTDRAA